MLRDGWPLAERDVMDMEYRIRTAASFWLDVGSPDYLAPFLGFVGDQFRKFGGREREHVATQVGKPRLDLGVGETTVRSL